MKLEQIAANNGNVHLRELATDRELAGDVQNRLIKLGCLDPPSDGTFGVVSTFVLTQYAKASGVAFDESIDKALAESLLDHSEDTFLPLTLGNDFASRIVKYMQLRNYWIARLPNFLNIVYVEGANADGTPNDDRRNHFNDRRILLAIENGRPVLKMNVLGTSEPGDHYMNNPLPGTGAVARIAFGQYKAWRVGKHHPGKRGEHEALVQVDTITVHRDFDRNGMRTGDRLDVGAGFYINQHSGYDAPANNIGRSSAGCLVSRTTADHREFMRLVKTDPRYRKASNGYKFMTAVLPGDDLHNRTR